MEIQTVELVLTAFLVVMLVSQIVSLKARVPYTLVLVFAGIVISVLPTAQFMAHNSVTSALQGVVSDMKSVYTSLVGGGLFVGLVVPPLIFEAMMHVRASDLRAVIRPSILLATIGVVVATVVGGLVLWQLAGLSFSASFLFAAIVSPTDVVTVLEIFRRAKVPPQLATLMNTEAAFNDATALVIFTIVLSSVSASRVPLFSAVSFFGLTTLGGAFIGLAIALAARRISALTDDKIAETVLTVTAVYGSYVLATGLGVSGLIAVAVVGLYFGNVTMKATVDQAARETVVTFWEIAAFIGNSIAFLLIGFETNISSLAESSFLIFAAYGAVTIARAASVYPILGVFGRMRERIPISWGNVAMLGGVRGALSIALAASLSGSAVLSNSDLQVVTTMVLGVAFLSISIQGTLLSRYIKRKFSSA
jgi:monovalent cation:H+ antiporter, CPA1 family